MASGINAVPEVWREKWFQPLEDLNAGTARCYIYQSMDAVIFGKVASAKLQGKHGLFNEYL